MANFKRLPTIDKNIAYNCGLVGGDFAREILPLRAKRPVGQYAETVLAYCLGVINRWRPRTLRVEFTDELDINGIDFRLSSRTKKNMDVQVKARLFKDGERQGMDSKGVFWLSLLPGVKTGQQVVAQLLFTVLTKREIVNIVYINQISRELMRAWKSVPVTRDNRADYKRVGLIK